MKKIFRTIYKIKNALFFTALGILAVIGAMWFARPETSVIEKRELTKFPKLTLSGVLDGSFASGVDKWYADTYPLREQFISGSYRLQALYGDRSQQIVNGGAGNKGDDIPDVPNKGDPTDGPTEGPTEGPSDTPTQGDSHDVTEPPTEAPTDAPTEAPTEAPTDAPVTGEIMGPLFVSGDTAYELYYFNRSSAESYATAINRAHQILGDNVNVYSLAIPLGSGILLDTSTQSSLGISDQRKAIEYINSLMDPGVHALNIFDNMKAHSSEYIYFRTDHHWTALGAYYAYQEFCKSKGVEAHALDQFKTMISPGFLGSFYSDARSSAMKANPDTVTAYYPMGTNSMMFTQTDGQVIAWNIIMDVNSYDPGSKYYCFSGSDEPYAYAHNPQITDGSSVVVLKDSFGNAFIPFLIDHYEYIYWIDFRMYNDSLSAFVAEKGIDDVIFCFNMNNVTNSWSIDRINKLLS